MNTETKDADTIARGWLARLNTAVSSGDVKATTALFLSGGWLRDILVFTWTHRSLCGHDAISAYLADNLKQTNVQSVKLESHSRPPTLVETPGMAPLVEAAFTFETQIANGRGFVRLMQDQGMEWKSLSCFVTVDDLKGHEEHGAESGVYEEHAKTWNEINEERKARIEKDPYVIIIGAAQSGLNVGARFRKMNIPTLLIEREPTIGNVWRQRYPMLTLHTPNPHHAMLYQPFPKDWPTFTPRDKFASWLQQYPLTHDLVVWTSSTVAATPSYDPSTKRWTVNIVKNGEIVTLHPYHIVMAAGTLGKPLIPHLSGRPSFEGEAYHATYFKGGSHYLGKKTVVVGTGNSAADICLELARRDAASVTMVQRSTTSVVKKSYVSRMLDQFFKRQDDDAIGDFVYASMPLGLLRNIFIAQKEARVEEQRDMIEGLQKAGLEIDEGPDGAGWAFRLYGRFGSYWLDDGTADMIINGKIHIKKAEPTAFIPKGLEFKDGSTIDADLVVFATGYESVVERVRETFGDEVANRTGPVWGLNEEFELNRCYSPSGYPGFWYAIGDCHNSRFYSKSLALQIKARELGLVKD